MVADLTAKSHAINQLIVAALSCNLTRVYTHQWAGPQNDSTYPIIQINGAPTDNNAKEIREGQLKVLQPAVAASGPGPPPERDVLAGPTASPSDHILVVVAPFDRGGPRSRWRPVVPLDNGASRRRHRTRRSRALRQRHPPIMRVLGAISAGRGPRRLRGADEQPHQPPGCAQRSGGAYIRPPRVHKSLRPRAIFSGEPMPILRSKLSP